MNTVMNRKLARKLWEQNCDKIPAGYEIHHIIPVHAGGADELSNLECLSKEEHRQRHLDRYESLGDFRDLCAYHMIGYNFTEAQRISSSHGGKIGGLLARERGIGIFKYDRTSKEYRELTALGGSAAQITLKERQISAFYDPRLREAICKKGGLASPTFKDSKMQSEFGKKGGVKNKGFRWYTDGENVFKYTPKMQKIESFEEFLEKNKHFRGGRI